MPNYNTIINSFQYGELTPKFAARTDTEQFQKGAGKIENMIVLPTGGVSRRPGSVYISKIDGSTIDGARLIEFIFSKTEVYMMLVYIDTNTGGLLMQPYRPIGRRGAASYGAPISLTLEGIQLWTQSHLDELQFVQKGDIVFMTQGDHPPVILRRFLDKNGIITLGLDYFLNFNSGKTTDAGWNVINRPYRDANISTTTLKPSATNGSITISTGPTTAITGTASSAGLINITSTAHGKKTDDKIVITGVVGTVEANGTWFVTVIDANNFTLQGSVFTNAWISGGTVFPPLFDALMGPQGSIAENATYFKIVQGTTTGAARVTAYTDPAHVTATVEINFADTSASDNWQESSWSSYRGWPRCIAIFESRLIMASNLAENDVYWGSLVNNFFLFMQDHLIQDISSDASGINFPGPDVETDPFNFAPSAKEVNSIEWIQSGKTLAVGTQGQEFVAFGSDTRILSKTAITMQDQSAIGSSRVQAIRALTATVFVGRDGKRLYQHNYDIYSQSYVPECLNSLAEHITEQNSLDFITRNELDQAASYGEDQFKFQSIRWQGTRKCLWARAGQSLIGMTWDPLVKCQGWHRHIFGGVGIDDGSGEFSDPIVMDVAIMPDETGTSDNLWVLLIRTVNGVVQYMLEVIGPDYDFPTTNSYSEGFRGGQEVGCWVDSAVSCHSVSGNLDNSSGVAVCSGFDHLIGQTVQVTADGFYHAPCVVSPTGTITLTLTATIVIAGLKYTPRLKLLPLEAGSQIGSAQGLLTRVDRMDIRFYNTLRAIITGPGGKTETPNFRPGNNGMGSPVPLFDGDKLINVPMSPDRRCELEISSDQPFPLTILGVIMKGQTYG